MQVGGIEEGGKNYMCKVGNHCEFLWVREGTWKQMSTSSNTVWVNVS